MITNYIDISKLSFWSPLVIPYLIRDLDIQSISCTFGRKSTKTILKGSRATRRILIYRVTTPPLVNTAGFPLISKSSSLNALRSSSKQEREK